MTVITSTNTLQRINWKAIAIVALTFWLCSSLLLDFVFMPTMYITGMMTEPGFAIAGYSLFGIFNRIELVCVSLALTSVLVLQAWRSLSHWTVPLAIGLLGVVLVCTYWLSPAMSSLGLELNLFEPAVVPAAMNQMHMQYWTLELMKLFGCAALLGQFYRSIA
jgi:Domain of unknown function (DUF4149)